jgi:mycobactin peptide synthetase MbtE
MITASTEQDALGRLLALDPSDRSALAWRDGELTYAELHHAVSGLAHGLAELGAAQANVLLYGPLSPAYVVGLLACLRASAVPVPIDAGLSPAQYAWIGKATRPSVVVTSDVSTVTQCHGDVVASEIVLDAATGQVVLDRPASTGAPMPSRYATRDAGYLIPSSGSTGAPKAIVGSRRGLHVFLTWFVEEFGLGPDDTVAAITRANFDPSLRELLGVLAAGGRLLLPEVDAQLDLRALADHLLTSRPTGAFLVPSIARRLADVLEARGARLPALRRAFFAGEVLPRRVVEQWAAIAPDAEVVNLYGMTEGTLAQVFRRDVCGGGDASEHGVPVGRPRPGVSIAIEGPDDVGRGEVLITSPAPAVGTLADGGSDGVFDVDPIPVPLRTGDIGFHDADGELVIVGRVGNDFKVHGKRVSFDRFVDEVEALPGVRQCVVLDRDGPQAFASVGEPADDAASGLRARIDGIARRLDLPRPGVHLRAELPLLRSGKVDRVRLAASVAGDRSAGDEREPGGPAAELLALLGLGGDVTSTTAFVDAGLTSVDMMDAIVAIERRVGVRLSVRECFGHRDAASLAEALAHAEAASSPALPQPSASEPGTSVPLSTRQVAYIATCMSDGNANWCNISRDLSLPREVAREDVEAALRALFARHDALRLALAPDWSHQVHAPADELRCPVVVVGAGSPDARQHRARVQEARVAAVAELLDPTAAPPVRVVIVGSGETTSVLLVAHHLFVDGLSLDLLAAELRALLDGEPLPAAPSPDGFRAYCRATRRAPGAARAGAAHWDALLRDAGQVALPEQPGAGAQLGELLSLPFGVAASRAAHRAAVGAGVSVFSVVLAAFDRAVRDTFGLDDLSIVVPVQVREGVDTATAGLFMSQLVIRGPGAGPLAARAAAVAQQVERGIANSEWEFDQRVDALGLGGVEHFPISTVLFNQHPHPRGLRVRDLGSWQVRALGRGLRYQLQGELQMSGPEMALTYYFRRGIADDAAALVARVHAAVLTSLCESDERVGQGG